jgi:hypothetical protein
MIPLGAQVALGVYMALGWRVVLQTEAFLGRLLLPLAEGKAAPGVARQEAALEVTHPSKLFLGVFFRVRFGIGSLFNIGT